MESKEFYEVPATVVLELMTEHIICDSPNVYSKSKSSTMSVTYEEEDW